MYVIVLGIFFSSVTHGKLTFIFKKYLPTRKLESQLMSTAIDMAAGRGP